MLHHVIIGNGGAGISALQAIRSVDTESEVTMISREKYPAYSPCSLPNFLSGEADQGKITRVTESFYNEHGARFLKNTEALRIDTEKREVVLASGEPVKFDRLLIAAGARPITPPMEGLGLEGVHVMGTMDSTLGIIEHAERGVEKAVVVGGGFMGIETAVNLKKRGVDVTIVELLPHVLARMLDPDMSERVENILIGEGVGLVLSDSVKAINGEASVEGVTLAEGGKMACDMVVVAIGVAPNTSLVEGSGIETNRGVLVDRTMRTSIDGVYAAGDIIEVTDCIENCVGTYAIWPNAIEQGRVAGLNMAGKEASYGGADLVNILNVFDTPVVAMGRTTAEIGECDVLSRSYPHAEKKIMLRDGRIVGLQFIGDIRNTGIFYGLMKRGEDVNLYRERLLDYNFVVAPR